MGRICSITAAMVLLTVPWVSAGTFDVLSQGAAVASPAPLLATPGKVVKAEYTSDFPGTPRMRTESDIFIPEQASPPPNPQVAPTPVQAFQGQAVRAMAPPPKSGRDRRTGRTQTAQKKEAVDPLELDLERDLVISPPPSAAEEQAPAAAAPAVETKGVKAQEKAVKKKADRKKAPVELTPGPPPVAEQYAASPKAIQKVRPLTRNPWSLPAGSHHPASQPPHGYACPPDSTRAGAPAAMPRRYVREGVTVTLAPRLDQALTPENAYDQDGPDVLSAAAELLAMPFAFISSLF